MNSLSEQIDSTTPATTAFTRFKQPDHFAAVGVVRFRPPFADVFITTLKVVVSLMILAVPLSIIYVVLSR